MGSGSSEDAVLVEVCECHDASAEESSVDAAIEHHSPQRKALFVAVIRWSAALVLLAGLAGAGYEGWLLFAQHQKDIAAEQALDAAQKYAVMLTSTDPNAIDQNIANILDGATGEFKDMYTKASPQLRKALIDNKVASHGAVLDSAVKSAVTDTVEVLLFVKQSISNSATPSPRTDITPVTMRMEKVDGRWLASKVDLPGVR